MKNLVLFLSIIFCSSTFASNPFEKTTHQCIANEMIKQFPIYTHLKIADFATFAVDDNNIEYMILLENPGTGRVDSRSFILITNGQFSTSQIYFTEFSRPASIDLRNCF